MKERFAKVIFWFISLSMFWAFINCVFIVNVQNNLDGLSVLVLGIITNPFIVDKISKKVGAEEPDYSYACKMLLIFGGILISFIIALVIFVFIDNKIGGKITLQDFEAILKITIYVIYLIVLYVCKSANKVFKYIVFGMFYFTCIILSFTSKSINESLIGILNSLLKGHLDMSTFELLINDFLTPIKESILTYIIFDTIMINKNRKQDKIGAVNIVKNGEDEVIRSEATDKTRLHNTRYKKKKYTPYNFNEKKEYRIYKNIGKRYRKEYREEKIKENKKFPCFDKYSEWEKYFIHKFLVSNYNSNNFLHFLNGKYRMFQKEEEYYKILVIPLYIALMTIILTIYSTTNLSVEKLIGTLVFEIIIVIAASIYYLYKIGQKVNFYEDCMKVINDHNASHQN